VAVFQLYNALTDFLAGHHNDLDHAVQISLENIIMEWTDVFADDVHKAAVSVFYAVIGK
jgi:TorA maturation chaperone TorD